jgi:hypothetical protein
LNPEKQAALDTYARGVVARNWRPPTRGEFLEDLGHQFGGNWGKPEKNAPLPAWPQAPASASGAKMDEPTSSRSYRKQKYRQAEDEAVAQARKRDEEIRKQRAAQAEEHRRAAEARPNPWMSQAIPDAQPMSWEEYKASQAGTKNSW